MVSAVARMAIAVVLSFSLAAVLPHRAWAAGKHHAAKVQTKKPAEQYLRSAAPPEQPQR